MQERYLGRRMCRAQWDWRAKKGVKDNCKIWGWISLSFTEMRNPCIGREGREVCWVLGAYNFLMELYWNSGLGFRREIWGRITGLISAFLRDLFLNLHDEVRSLFSLFRLHRTPCLYILTTIIVANLFFVILQLLIDYPPLPPNCKVHEGKTLSVFNSLVSPRQLLHSWGLACIWWASEWVEWMNKWMRIFVNLVVEAVWFGARLPRESKHKKTEQWVPGSTDI